MASSVAGYSTREVAELLDLAPRQVRRLARSGLVRPERGPGNAYRFSFRDLVLLRTAADLRRAGVPSRRVRRALHDLKEELPEDRPLSALRIGAEGGRVVVREGGTVWSPGSDQVQLDFESPDPAAASEEAGAGAPEATRAPEAARAPGAPAGDGPSAERWFERGTELEATDRAAARGAYRRALELDPGHADARVNLGSLLLEDGRAEAAVREYRQALEADPDHALAAFDLGVALEELERPTEAAEAYRKALELDPGLADAHFNLAGVLERAGDRGGALRHLRAYRELRPAGEG